MKTLHKLKIRLNLISLNNESNYNLIPFNRYINGLYSEDHELDLGYVIHFYKLHGDRIVSDCVEYTYNVNRDHHLTLLMFSLVGYETICDKLKDVIEKHPPIKEYIEKTKKKFDLLNNNI